MKQLATKSEKGFAILEEFYSKKTNSGRDEFSASARDLSALLKKMALNFDKVFIVIDGLDECGEPSTRFEVLATLKNLNDSLDNRLRLLYTSRDEVDIREALSSFEKISIAARSSDIELYVLAELRNRIQSKRLRIADPKLASEISNTLVTKAQGM